MLSFPNGTAFLVLVCLSADWAGALVLLNSFYSVFDLLLAFFLCGCLVDLLSLGCTFFVVFCRVGFKVNPPPVFKVNHTSVKVHHHHGVKIHPTCTPASPPATLKPPPTTFPDHILRRANPLVGSAFFSVQRLLAFARSFSTQSNEPSRWRWKEKHGRPT